MTDERTTKNQVFNVHDGSQEHLPPKPSNALDALRAEFGLDMPVATVPLPSNGRVYPASSPLYGKTELEIRPMTAREEDILTNKVLLKKGTVITELIRSCLIDKAIDVGEMIAGDRNALMVSIRATGYGHEYDAEVTCGNEECEQKSSRTFNLNELEVKRLSISPIEEGSNLFEFTLPSSKIPVLFKFLTGNDETEITTTQERQKKMSLNTSNAVTMNLMHCIVSVKGSTDRAKISKFIQMMPVADSFALREYIKKNEPGIVMKQVTECPSCEHREEVAIPIGVTFLYPGFKS